MILFGTGQLLTNDDRNDTTPQYLYGILDKMDAVPVTVPNTFSATSLVQQTFTDVYSVSTTGTVREGTYRKVSDNAIDLTAASNTNLGWAIRLPTSSERLVSTPLVFDDKVLFGTGIPISAEKCLPGGSGWILGLNPLTGSLTRKDNKSAGTAYSFIDMNKDNRSTSADKVPFSSGTSFISGYSKNGIPTEISYVSSTSVLTGPSDPSAADNAYGNAGSVIALRESNSQGVYTGIGPASKGSAIKKQPSSGKGPSCTGTVGNDSLECETLLGAPSPAARLTSTLWREIK
jgi:type IV pilus assembly protein PilY1